MLEREYGKLLSIDAKYRIIFEFLSDKEGTIHFHSVGDHSVYR